ncbi:helix-turn-helix domain-containing protein [Fulvimarina manganoxydans]|uniref:helix-turn-helix domain-containing protein n=1 Tax=Fulvimarina manganoxydans TaxID=937218 RepID=UPI001FCDC70A|nr:helix-turn-helix transcriptional regulator [Fulvimarina manganoxydans]
MTLFDPIDVHVGARVKLRRKRLGMSQERLGATLNVTFQQIQKYERGANRIGASNLYKISCALGVSPAFFFEGIDPDMLPVSSPKPPVSEANPTAIGDRKVRQAVEDLIQVLVERTS